jgi:hypothetical protein
LVRGKGRGVSRWGGGSGTRKPLCRARARSRDQRVSLSPGAARHPRPLDRRRADRRARRDRRLQVTAKTFQNILERSRTFWNVWRSRGALRAASAMPPGRPESKRRALYSTAFVKQLSRGPSLPYKVDTSRPSLRTNWTRPLAGSTFSSRRAGRTAGRTSSSSFPPPRARTRPGFPACRSPPPPLPPRTNWTRRVLHPVLIGHAASLTPYKSEPPGNLMNPDEP